MKFIFALIPVAFLLSACGGGSSLPGSDVNGYKTSPCACGPIIKTPNVKA